MSDLGNPDMEIAARRIFRQAVYLHYIEGLTCGEAIQQWLRTHGGFFRDNQQMYEADVVDDPEDIMSNNPLGAILEAPDLMKRLYYTLRIVIDEAYLQRSIEARNGADIRNYGGSTPQENALAALALNWLVSMGLAQPNPDDDIPQESPLDSTSTVGMLGSSDGSRSRSRSRSRSPLRNFQMDGSSEWPILVGPGIFIGRQNRIERETGHQFTGIAHRLQ
jgi:hypothetical protein